MGDLMRISMLILFGFFIASCAAHGPRFSGVQDPDPGQAVVYVYRSPKFAGSGIYPRISVDGEGCHLSKSGTYLRFELEPGTHDFAIIPGEWRTMDWESITVSIELKNGDVRFLKFVTNLTDFSVLPMGVITVFSSSFGHAFFLVDRDTGIEEIVDTHLTSIEQGCEE